MLINIHRQVVATFSNLSTAALISLNIVLLLLIGWADFVTGDYSLVVFYMIPVSIVAWFASSRFGVLFCFLAIAVRFLVIESATSFIFSHSMLHYWNELVEFLFLLFISLLFSALKKKLENEKMLASHDPLTGALNRRSFFELAEYEINHSRRYGLPLTAAYIDLDNFKEINDVQGHRVGDEVLVMTVSTIRANMRSTDILARFGGDEFVILLPATSGDAAKVFLKKIHDHLDDATNEQKWPVTFSIGAVTYIKASDSIDEVVQKADELMYIVKRSSKNRLLHKELGG